jgi:hypothetical protein
VNVVVDVSDLIDPQKVLFVYWFMGFSVCVGAVAVVFAA